MRYLPIHSKGNTLIEQEEFKLHVLVTRNERGARYVRQYETSDDALAALDSFIKQGSPGRAEVYALHCTPERVSGVTLSRSASKPPTPGQAIVKPPRIGGQQLNYPPSYHESLGRERI